MLYLFTFLTLLLSFLRNSVAYVPGDELMDALVKAAREQGLVAGLPAPLKNKPGPKPGPPASPNLRTLKDKPKPDPKPKPSPPQYMVFSNHIDDSTCGERSAIESHGYLIGNCFTGKGDLTGLYWSFTSSVGTTNINLNYAFYPDADCATTPVFSSVEVIPNGCAVRGSAGGYLRSKNFQISTSIPKFKGGSLFNGYETEALCKRDKRDDVVVWNFLKNNACDPHIHSPVYGEHLTDETRTCKRNKLVATLYDSNDLTCSGEVTTTTNVGSSWDCADTTLTGVDGTFVNSKCV